MQNFKYKFFKKDSNACGDLRVEVIGKSFANTFGDDQRVLTGGPGHDDRKLVPAVAVAAVHAVPNQLAQKICRFFQSLVAARVAMGVIEPLEAVEVEKAQGEVSAASQAALDFFGDRREKAPLVVQARQFVGVGEFLQGLLELHMFGYVLGDAEKSDGAAFHVMHALDDYVEQAILLSNGL